MVKNRTLVVVMILAALAVPMAFADGLFVQSPLQPSGVEYTYASQLGVWEVTTQIPTNAVLQAIGSENYPVTPGDTFTLSYFDGKSPVTLALQADSDCKVVIQSVGVVDASGMTYRQFKAYVEKLVSSYYSFSSPQVTLTGCGVFTVKVAGQVTYAQYVTAWGLTRLSDLCLYVTPYASTREVTITFADGSSKTYDLFNALRNANDADNPLLAPGCTVCFAKADAIVTLGGAVKSAGVYQMLPGQSLYDLVCEYGCGMIASADANDITVASFVNGTYTVKTFDIEAAKTYVPADGDVVTVAQSAQSLPFVTITGAVSSPASNTISSANKVSYSFIPGETALQLIRSISHMLLPTSDLSSIYVLRGGQKIAVDASEALSSSEKGDLVLEMGDTIVIPFSQLTVTVTGAVKNPGTYAYVPDRGVNYYINLAGGFTQTATEGVKVLDKDGNKLSDKANVPADSTIVANNNNLTTNLAIAASVLSLVSTVLTIIINTHTISNF
ncbi:MAG: SLBB domain-containing protein [Sphaerochaetaceae bacterium]|nr:SLBB domain-containing protein [Sphaerochaetaceae bacterium]